MSEPSKPAAASNIERTREDYRDVTMAKQVLARSAGGAEVLEFVDAPVPVPGRGQVLVRVQAAGVPFGDVLRRTDRYLNPTPIPYRRGTEVAGTVAEVGSDVDGLRLGDRVVSRVASGGYAQYAVADADTATIIPTGLGFAESTALLARGVTAHLLTSDVAALGGKAVFVPDLSHAHTPSPVTKGEA